MNKYLTIDIDAAKVRYAVVTDELDVLDCGSEYSVIDDKDRLLDIITGIALKYKDQTEGMSVTLPGVIDSVHGIAYSGGVYKWVHDFHYQEELEKRTDMRVAIANDAKAAAYAEMGYGSLKKVQNGVLLMILGSGIGGAVINDGKLMNGAHFAAGEFSYMMGDYKNRENGNDLFTTAMSLNGLNQCVMKSTGRDKMNMIKIMAGVNSGDDQVIKGVTTYCDRLASYMYNIQCVVDAQRFVLGGSLIDEPALLKMIRDGFDRKYDSAPFRNIFKPEITDVCFHNDSRKYGAVYLFRQLYGEGEKYD
jgi:predicted NBD/HSP70 family sugar kinase